MYSQYQAGVRNIDCDLEFCFRRQLNTYHILFIYVRLCFVVFSGYSELLA